jgi:hypothetical protein
LLPIVRRPAWQGWLELAGACQPDQRFIGSGRKVPLCGTRSTLRAVAELQARHLTRLSPVAAAIGLFAQMPCGGQATA